MFTQRSAEKERETRNRARAAALDGTLGGELRQDDVGSWRGSAQRGDIQISLALGSAPVRQGFTYVLSEWTEISAERSSPVEPAWTLRSPVRTAFEYHDGLPGEAPNLTVGSRALVLVGAIGDPGKERLARWLAELPQGLRLVALTPKNVRFRAALERTDDELAFVARGIEIASGALNLALTLE